MTTAPAPLPDRDASAGWRVIRGHCDVFAVPRAASNSRRCHLFRVATGEIVLSGNADHPGARFALVPGPEAELAPLSPDAPPGAADLALWQDRLVGETARLLEDQAPDAPLSLADATRRCLDAALGQMAANAEAARLRAEAGEAEGERRLGAALRDLASVVGRAEAPDDGTPGFDAVVARIATALRVDPPARPVIPSPGTAPATRLALLARAYRLGRRTVRLAADFERRPGPPLVGWLGETDQPVALIHDGRRWTVSDGGPPRPLSATDRAGLAGEAVQLSPLLPPGALDLRALIRFGAAEARGDWGRIALGVLATASLGGVLPVAAHMTMDRLIPASDTGALAGLMGILTALALAGGCFALFRGLAAFRLQARFEARVQPALLERLLHLPAAVRRAHTVGDLADRVLGIEAARQQIGAAALAAVFGGVFGFASLVPLFVYDAGLALLGLGLALAVSLVVVAIALGQLRSERIGSTLQGVLDGFVLQLLVGMSKVRVAAAERRAMAEWSARFVARRRLQRVTALWAGTLEIAVATLPILATLVLYAGMTGLGTDGTPRLTPAAFVAFCFGFGQLMGALSGAGLALVGLLGAIPLIERARPILATPVEHAPDGAGSVARPGTVTLSQVSFRYGAEGPLILDGLDLHIARGEFVAIVGPSGSGKSTLLRLILGLEMPSAGDVLFDGRRARDLDMAAVRRQIGTVLQTGRLSSGSIFENIAAGTFLEQSRAWAAARRAGLEDDIRALPMGMHTVLLDGGATLSGGQCQRILIARALARDPSILLFDEATSALDNRSQQQVMDTLAAERATRIVVAHRLSTIRSADRIVVLEAGRIVETGNFDDLMARNGPFARLAARQLL